MSTSAQAKFNDTINRLDELLDQRVRREEADLRRADATIEEARRQRQRAHAEARVAIQAVYADAYRSFGTEVPSPVDDEPPARYRARLFNRLARRLPPDHELAQIRADDINAQPIVFDNFEAMLLQAATAEGERPSVDNLPSDGSLVSRIRTDDMGEKHIDWYGRESFIKGFTRPGRHVERIVDPRTQNVIWGSPFSRAG